MTIEDMNARYAREKRKAFQEAQAVAMEAYRSWQVAEKYGILSLRRGGIGKFKINPV